MSKILNNILILKIIKGEKLSFSKEIKKEILAFKLDDDSKCLAFLSGFLNSSAYVDINEKIITLTTELEEASIILKSLLKKFYGYTPETLLCAAHQIMRDNYYKITISGETSIRLLLDTGCAKIDNGSIVRNFDVDEYLIKESDTLRAFVQGAFVGCGTSSIKIDSESRLSTGYHLEFASKNYAFLSGLGHILAQFDISAKLVKRKNLNILYIKDAEQVSNALALMGANEAVLSLQNEMATRQLRNKVNRQTNCVSANIEKTVSASIRQNDAIELIVQKIGLESLPNDLQNVALLRIANPEESLEELVKLATFKITKSALNYRLNKLIKIADKLKE